MRSADAVCTVRDAIRRCCQCRDVSRSLERISKLCAEPFAFRRHEKKRKERLEEEYKSKIQRLKTVVKHTDWCLRCFDFAQHDTLRGYKGEHAGQTLHNNTRAGRPRPYRRGLHKPHNKLSLVLIEERAKRREIEKSRNILSPCLRGTRGSPRRGLPFAVFFAWAGRPCPYGLPGMKNIHTDVRNFRLQFNSRQ